MGFYFLFNPLTDDSIDLHRLCLTTSISMCEASRNNNLSDSFELLFVAAILPSIFQSADPDSGYSFAGVYPSRLWVRGRLHLALVTILTNTAKDKPTQEQGESKLNTGGLSPDSDLQPQNCEADVIFTFSPCCLILLFKF